MLINLSVGMKILIAVVIVVSIIGVYNISTISKDNTPKEDTQKEIILIPASESKYTGVSDDECSKY